MNQVHEQCPKIDSGTVLSQTGSKTGRVHRVHSLLAQQHARLRAQRPCRSPAAQATCAPRAAAAAACLARALACCRSPAARAPRSCLPASPARPRAVPALLLRAPLACCAPQGLPARPARVLRSPRAHLLRPAT